MAVDSTFCEEWHMALCSVIVYLYVLYAYLTLSILNPFTALFCLTVLVNPLPPLCYTTL